jgi:hypothetical protein
MKIELLKRKHDPDCGVGSWCDCGADVWNKEVDWIIKEVRLANANEEKFTSDNKQSTPYCPSCGSLALKCPICD